MTANHANFSIAATFNLPTGTIKVDNESTWLTLFQSLSIFICLIFCNTIYWKWQLHISDPHLNQAHAWCISFFGRSMHSHVTPLPYYLSDVKKSNVVQTSCKINTLRCMKMLIDVWRIRLSHFVHVGCYWVQISDFCYWNHHFR